MSKESDALREILALTPRPFMGMPADWHEQIAACDECQGWAKNHPIQNGICDKHRQPLWDREKHEAFEQSALFPRACIIARAALDATTDTFAECMDQLRADSREAGLLASELAGRPDRREAADGKKVE